MYLYCYMFLIFLYFGSAHAAQQVEGAEERRPARKYVAVNIWDPASAGMQRGVQSAIKSQESVESLAYGSSFFLFGSTPTRKSNNKKWQLPQQFLSGHVSLTFFDDTQSSDFTHYISIVNNQNSSLQDDLRLANRQPSGSYIFYNLDQEAMLAYWGEMLDRRVTFNNSLEPIALLLEQGGIGINLQTRWDFSRLEFSRITACVGFLSVGYFASCIFTQTDTFYGNNSLIPTVSSTKPQWEIVISLALLGMVIGGYINNNPLNYCKRIPLKFEDFSSRIKYKAKNNENTQDVRSARAVFF